MPAEISIVIPVRAGGSPATTLRSLAHQSFQDFDIVVSRDHAQRGACWARNKGAALAKAPLILFSDDDIVWEPRALEVLYGALKGCPSASIAYGSYSMDGRPIGDQSYDAALLRRRNYISTMALLVREHAPQWDESILRLQDWDLWLTMLEQGRSAVYCGQRIFTTTRKDNGITYGSIDWVEAERRVKEKHGLA